MTGREDEAQQVVADVIVERGVELALGALLPGAELVPELHVLALEQLAAAEQVDGVMLRRGHEPGARVVRHARLGPPLERRHEGVLREILRRADVARHPRQAGDELGRLDPPHRVDRAMRVGYRHRLASFCAIRALTSFRTSAAGRGLSTVKRMVPLAV
jgi:hypothetical protein